MAYFSNSSEAEVYENKWCKKCMNYRTRGNHYGCPILDLHWFCDPNVFHDDDSRERKLLDSLIPMKDGYPSRCSMFFVLSEESLTCDDVTDFLSEMLGVVKEHEDYFSLLHSIQNMVGWRLQPERDFLRDLLREEDQ